MTSTTWPAVRPPGPRHLRPMPSMPGVKHHFRQARGVSFHVAQAGSGDPVVLLHDVAQHWYAWHRLIPELASRYQLFCIDLRGCGWSEGTSTGYDTEAQSQDVLAVMDALGLERAHLIGHGSSGWIGFRLCLMAPERFGAFLALNTTHPWPARTALVRHAWRFWYTAFWEYPVAGSFVLRRWPGFTRMLLRRWAGPSHRWDPATLDEFVRASTGRAAARAVQQTLWQFVLHDIPGLLSGGLRGRPLTVPTLLLGGELDPVARLDPGQDLSGHADALEIEMLPGGHLLPETAPKLVAAAARDLFG